MLIRLWSVGELDCIHLLEILLGLLARRGTQSLVILDLPPLCTLGLAPLLILVIRVEDALLCTLVCLDDRCGHVGQEPWNRHELVPELVEEIDQ